MKKFICIILFLVNQLSADAQVTLPNLQSLQYVNSNLGNALNFNGDNTYGIGKAYVTDSIVDFTIEFWIKNTGTDDSNDRIYGSYFNNALQIGKDGTSLKILATDLGSILPWQTVCALESNVWVHIAIIRNENNLQIFKNAILVATYTVDAAAYLPSFFRLGSNINGRGENANFSIDELRIWKSAISVSPINFIKKYMYTPIDPTATSDQNPSTKLVLYYRFDQGIVGGSNPLELGLYNSAISN